MTDFSDSGRQRASRTDLINEVQRLNDTRDHTPTFQDMDKHGNYSGALYAVRSDSWNEALEAAGFESRSNTQHRISDEELLNDLREFADTLDKTPSSKEMNQDGPYISNTYNQRF